MVSHEQKNCTPVASLDFATQVTSLVQKMENIMGWIWTQANTIAKDNGDKHVATKKKPSSSNTKTDLPKMHHGDDDVDAEPVAKARF